jgi:hypothetical protein
MTGIEPFVLGSLLTAGASVAGTAIAANNKPGPAAPPPVVEPPKPMPLPDDEATAKARRRELTKISETSGRASTFLSDTKLGSSGVEKLG